ncbi:hypothetical protein P6B95_42000 [Streptomyces atratus]|uniref:hypothetical protein n=1 Tax=Streptomyces atratus TaxID=1893 RepID=UPI002AC33DA3|nr:hypothetical protein [Streptomyces atratus]WPW33764.1 hypothetical protein P6B95_00570 [Streptomyces atratus]WPW33796.1 hypothetical protein P6B95_42000 [Streptomyces atratus]
MVSSGRALPLDFELVLPAGAGSSTLTAGVRDSALGRRRATHNTDASSHLPVASWPPDPNPAAGGAGTFPGN